MDFIREFDELISIGTKSNIEKAILNFDNEFFYEFVETLYLVTRYYFNSNNPRNENFSFIANSSLSGGRHPCSEAECRFSKIEQLASFATLYSDEVYIQNPFEQIVLNGPENINLMSRKDIISGIYSYLYLKPLIKRGIIKYALNKVSLCDTHMLSLATPISEQIYKKEQDLYNLIHEVLIERCEVLIDVNAHGTPFFEIKGPSDFIKHGAMYFHYLPPVSQYMKSLCLRELPYTFSKREVIEENILGLIINPIIKDLSAQEWHSKFYGTSYLCDNQIQINVATSINPLIYKANLTSFNSAVLHYLPTIQSKNLESVLKIRDKEDESFKVYRDKVNSLIKKNGSWESAKISEVFREQILPEINIIEKK